MSSPPEADEIFRLDLRPDVVGRAERLFERLAPSLRKICPGAQVFHVGGTSVPGVPTKGDLDVQVRVPRARFAAAKERLEASFAVNPGGFQLPDGISFEDKRSDPPAGIHLTAIGGACDIQWVFTAVLRDDPALLDRYAAIKARFDGRSMAEYRDAKAAFFEELQASPRFAQVRAG